MNLDVRAKPRRGIKRLSLGALSGLLAGYAAIAVAELVSAAVRPESGPVIAVGGAAIDRTPPGVKDWAIRHFGTNDKLVLQLGILAVLTVLALVLGAVAARWRVIGSVGVLAFGVVGALAATSRPDSTSVSDALPSVVGAVVGAALLYWLIGRLGTFHGAADEPGERSGTADTGAGAVADDAPVGGATSVAPQKQDSGWDRRGFILAATAAAAGSTGAGLAGRALNGSQGQNAVASRKDIVLPAPSSRAAAVPKGAALRIKDISP
ncbi:hypothetical protein K377_07938, partial [Streptomyces sp. PsTaAH-137]